MMNNGKKATRRRFLITAAGVVGAGVVCCSGAGFAAMQQPKIDFIEQNLGKESEMGKKILIAYASKCGSTGEIARAVGEVLVKHGASVDVRRVQEVRDLKGYDAVVVGGAARMGKLLPEAVNFVNRQRKALATLPTAYFTAGLTMKEDTPENRKTAAGYLQPLVDVRKPAAALGLFAGVIDYDKMEWILRSMLSWTRGSEGGMPEGDFRNWAAIEKWADEVAQAVG